jgi:hypothetical protein
MKAITTGFFGQHFRALEQTKTENTCYVSPSQFCELLTSRRNLLRSDDRTAKLRGLVDPSIGVRFLVREEDLAKLAQ